MEPTIPQFPKGIKIKPQVQPGLPRFVSHTPVKVIADIPKMLSVAQTREWNKRVIMYARRDYIWGSETPEEVANRYAIPVRNVTIACNAEGWDILREDRLKNLAKRIEDGGAKKLIEKRHIFFGDGQEMLRKLSGLIHRHLERLESERPDADGTAGTLDQVLKVARTVETYLVVGRKNLGMDQENAMQSEEEDSTEVHFGEPLDAEIVPEQPLLEAGSQ